MLNARASYKKVCRKAERSFRTSLAAELREIENGDPKSFWNLLSKMRKWGKINPDSADNIEPDRWVNHFTKLLNTAISSPRKAIDFRTFEPILDSILSLKEIKEALRDLKAGKAHGPDGILLEFIRVLAETHPNLLHKLMNTILSNHFYPKVWDTSFL